MTPAFPSLPEETLPPEPMAMHMTPDGTAWWIAGMAGQIKQVSQNIDKPFIYLLHNSLT